MIKDYRLVARLKNNRLWESITGLFPAVVTQGDAARVLNLGMSEFGDLLNMTYWPRCPTAEWNRPHGFPGRGCRCRDGWFLIAWKISTALSEDPAYLFDRILYGTRPNLVNLAVDRQDLLGIASHVATPGPDEALELVERNELLRKAIDRLPPRHRMIVSGRFGLDGATHTLQELGDALNLSRERVHQIERRSLRRLLMTPEARAARGMM